MHCWFDRQGIKGCGVGLTDKGCGVGLTNKGLRGVVLV